MVLGANVSLLEVGEEVLACSTVGATDSIMSFEGDEVGTVVGVVEVRFPCGSLESGVRPNVALSAGGVK